MCEKCCTLEVGCSAIKNTKMNESGIPLTLEVGCCCRRRRRGSCCSASAEMGTWRATIREHAVVIEFNQSINQYIFRDVYNHIGDFVS